MRRSARLWVLCGSLALPLVAIAHGAEKHDEKPAQAGAPVEERTLPTAAAPGAEKHDDKPAQPGAPVEERTLPTAAAPAPMSIKTLIRDLDFAAFPTLHPMAVHVPVTFIPLALLFALIALFGQRRVFIGLAFGFTLGGLAGGLVAAFPLHPHTTGLSPAASETLAKHDLFAYGTLWLTLVAALVGLACLWRPGALRRLLLGLVLAFAAASVSITAHYGGTLAYVHGVGVQGRYLLEH